MRRSRFYYERYNNTLRFDVNRAYDRYARECADRYAMEHGKRDFPPSPILTGAAMCLRAVFPENRARALSQRMNDLIESKDEHAVRPADAESLQIIIRKPLQMLGEGVLDVLRHTDVHHALLQFFHGHYRIYALGAWRTIPAPADKVMGSWLWHSDSYPPHTCKLFLHLTPANAETGATEFMNLEDTMAYRRAGYFGQFRVERYADLQDFAKAHGIPYRPFHLDAEPGDATLFNMNFFHRAVSPRKAIRDVVQFFFVPSLIPWEEHYKRDIDRLMTTLGGFPNDPRLSMATAASTSMM